jgi:hypothetical protein
MAHVSINTASVAQLNTGIDAVTTTIVLSGPTFTGWPSTFPYWAIIARGTSLAEIVEVTAGAGATLTATRGRDGTSAAPHNTGDTFEHIIPADTANRAEQHIDATAAHGATGAVVGTTNAQTLTNKLYQGGHKHVFTDANPAGLTAGYESVADSAAARDGFVHRNTAGDVDRRGFMVEQSGTPRIELYNDGTIKSAPSGAATRKGIETTTSIKAGTTLEVGTNATVTGTLGVTGATTLSSLGASGNATVGGTLGVTGTSTLGVVNSGNHAITGTLSASGASTLAAVSASGIVTASAGVKSWGSSVFDIATVTSLPGSPATNTIVFLTTNKLFHRYNGSAWEIIALTPHAQFRQTTVHNVADTTWTNVSFTTEDFDDIASHDTVTNTALFVAPFAGVYEFAGGVTIEANTAGRREARWIKNQTTPVNASHSQQFASAQFVPISLNAKTIQVTLAVNDNIALQVLQTSGITLQTVVNVEQACSMSVKFLGV